MIVTQNKPGWDDRSIRASIDGRVAFATAVFVLGAFAFVLLDRIGAPARLVAGAGPALAAAGLATIGFMLGATRVSSFVTAGRTTPGVYAGLAMAALGAGLMAPFSSPAPDGASLSALVTGFSVGLALAAIVIGPLLRKTGAFSIADLMAARFPSLTLRVGMALAISAIGLCTGLAGLSMAQRTLVQATALGQQASTFLAAGVVALIVVPGGMAGLTWSATGAAGLLIAGIATPLALMIASGDAIPLPLPGDHMAFEQALARMAQWRGGSSAPVGDETAIIMAMALGLGALGPLLAPLMTTPSKGEARSGGFMGLVWCAILALMALAVATASTLALQASVTGLRLTDLPPFLLEASAQGFVAICGAHPATIAQAREACAAAPTFAGALRPGDLGVTSEYLLLGLPGLSAYGAALPGLAMAGRMAIGLVLAAAGFLALATALGDGAFYLPHKPYALASRRLAATRFMLLCAIAGSAWLLGRQTTDPRLLIGVALGLSAVTIAPLLALALWPRAEGQDGAIALVTGLALAEAIILLAGEPMTIGLAAAAAVGGFAAAALVGFAVSFLHPADPTSEGAAFVHAMLHGHGDALRPDKGA